MPSASSLSSSTSSKGPRRGKRSRHSVKTMNTSRTSESSDILVNPDVMTLLSEELHVAIVDSKVQRVGIRGKLEIRAKVKPGSDSAISNNPNIRGAFLLHLDSSFPLLSLKHDSHYIRRKSSGKGAKKSADQILLKSSSSSNLSVTMVNHLYQCLLPAHPSRKQAIKVLQFVVKPQRSFNTPLVQHIKVSPSIMIDSTKGLNRVAVRLKLTSNPSLPSKTILSRVVISAKFDHIPM